MQKLLLGLIFAPFIGASSLLFASSPAAAACTVTYTFSNTTTADATQVNQNFSDLTGCVAPAASPAFTGASQFSGTITDPTDGNTDPLVKILPTISPTANSGANTVGVYVGPSYDTSFNLFETGVNAPTGGLFQNLIINTGTIADISGAEFWGLWIGGDAASMGTVSSVQAAEFNPVVSFGNSLTTTVTRAVGIHVLNGQKNTLTLTGQAGIIVDPLTAATNNTAILIGQTTVPSGSFGIYNASTNNNYLNGSVGIGTSAPAQKLEVNGKVKIDSFGSATASTVCQLSGVLSSCSSSIRYKENVQTADLGLSEIEKMRPVTFKWKGRDERDFGFIAEEMGQVNPLFVTYKDNRIEGVKYPQLTAVLAHAVQEQQKEIRALRAADYKRTAELRSMRAQLTALTRSQRQRTAMNDDRSLPGRPLSEHH